MKKRITMVTLMVLVVLLCTGIALACENGQHNVTGKCGETVICPDCGETVKIEHIFENFKVSCNPTCTEGGSMTAVCEREGCTAECCKSVRALGHEFLSFIDNGDGTFTAVCEHDGCHVTHTELH